MLINEIVIYESSQPQPLPNQLTHESKMKLLKAIVGFEMPRTRHEGKFKNSSSRIAGTDAARLTFSASYVGAMTLRLSDGNC